MLQIVMLRYHPVIPVNSDFANLLMVLVYLVVGTIGIALLGGWALKRFGPHK